MKKNKIIMVIVNYNNYQDTLRCVSELSGYASVDSIVIVDNFSTNDSTERMGEVLTDEIILIKLSENSGYASGNNAGISYAIDKYGTESIVFIVNPDVSVEQEAIDNVVNFILRNKNIVGAVAPKGNEFSAWKYPSINERLFVENKILKSIFPRKSKKLKYYENDSEAFPVDVLSGAFFAMYGKTWKNVGYFDSNTFLYYEEEILYKRLKKIKKQSYQLNNSSFQHIGQSSTGTDNTLGTRRSNESRNYLIKKYEKINGIQKIAFLMMNETNLAFSAFINFKKKYLNGHS